MEFDEETDCKNKLDEQKKSLQRQLRDIEKFASMDPVFREGQKVVWKEDLEEIERKRTELPPRSIRRCRKGHRSCTACRIRRGSSSRMPALVRRKRRCSMKR